MVSAVASLEVLCVYTVPSVEDDGSENDSGCVVASARGVGGTTRSVGEAMQTNIEDGLEERKERSSAWASRKISGCGQVQKIADGAQAAPRAIHSAVPPLCCLPSLHTNLELG